MNQFGKDYEAIRRLIDENKYLKEDGNDTLEGIYNHTVSANARKTVAIYFDEDGKRKKMSYRRFGELTRNIAARLSTLFEGLEQGPIALKMRNSENWPILFYAIAMNGREVLLVDSRLKKDNAANLIRQAGAKAVLANEVDPYEVKSLRMNEITSARPDPDFVPHFANKVIFASSGTTGDAKLIEMTGHNLAYQIISASNLPEENCHIVCRGRCNNLAMIPFHHIFGFVAVFLWYTYYGETIVYPSTTSIRDVMYAIRKGPATHIYSVPMFWDGVAQTLERTISLKGGKIKEMFDKMIASGIGEISKKEAGFAGSSLFRNIIKNKAFGTKVIWCISGGGAVSKKTLRLINGLGYPLSNGYGMTELGVVCVEKRPDPKSRLEGSIGTLFEGFEAKIRDGKEEGELLIKSPTIHESEIIGGKRIPTPLEDGYFATGDIAAISEGKYLFIKGRLKDTIIDTNGENVYPDEIEDYFRGLPHVKNVACFGLERDGREKICLALETDNASEEGAIDKIKAAFEEINASLPSEKKVDLPYIYRHSLPISGSMKVKRFALRDELAAGSREFIPLYETENAGEKGDFWAGFDGSEVKGTLLAVRKIFASNLQLLEEKVGYGDIWDRDLGGDSMSYVAMVSDLNDHFHIEIPTELYGKIGTVNDFAKEVLILTGKGPREGANS